MSSESELRKDSYRDRVGARVLYNQDHIRTFANFTDACARRKTPCFGEPDLFFSDLPDDIKRAKEKCATCPLMDGCLNFALDARQVDGTWGGLSAQERAKILKARRAFKQKQWKRQREARAAANQTALFELQGA